MPETAELLDVPATDTPSNATLADYHARNRSATANGDGDHPRIAESIRVENIEPSKDNPRKGKPQDIESLADSIRQFGLFSPIMVQLHPAWDPAAHHYEIVAGSRRFAAYQLLGKTHIPAFIVDYSDKTGMARIVENVQRSELNPVHIGEAIKEEMQKNRLLTQFDVAKMVNKSQSWVAAKIGLTTLPGAVQRGLLLGDLSESHGKALVGLSSHPERASGLVVRILLEGLSSKQTEQEVARIKAEIERAEKESAAQAALPIQVPTSPAHSQFHGPRADPDEGDAAAPDTADPLLEDTDEDAPTAPESDDEVVLGIDDDPDFAPLPEEAGEMMQRLAEDSDDSEEETETVADTETVTIAPPTRTVPAAPIAPASHARRREAAITDPTDLVLEICSPYAIGLLDAINTEINTKYRATVPGMVCESLNQRLILILETYAGGKGIETEPIKAKFNG